VECCGGGKLCERLVRVSPSEGDQPSAAGRLREETRVPGPLALAREKLEATLGLFHITLGDPSLEFVRQPPLAKTAVATALHRPSDLDVSSMGGSRVATTEIEQRKRRARTQCVDLLAGARRKLAAYLRVRDCAFDVAEVCTRLSAQCQARVHHRLTPDLLG
jgi:hypothetical protein